MNTTEVQPHVILEMEKQQESDIKMKRNGPYKYNNRSSTKRVNHVKTLKTAPNMFKIDAAEKL